MRNEIAFGLMVIACGGGVLFGRALPRDPYRDPRAVPRPAPSATFVPSRKASCSVEVAELAEMRTQLAICKAFTPRDPPVEPPAKTAVEAQVEPPAEGVAETPEDFAAKSGAQMRRNLEVLRKYGEAIGVRRFDGTVALYPPDAQIDDGLIVARILPTGEIAHYDPDAGPRTDPSAFRVPPPGSALAHPKSELGPDGLLYIDGKLADPAMQKMFGLRPR